MYIRGPANRHMLLKTSELVLEHSKYFRKSSIVSEAFLVAVELAAGFTTWLKQLTSCTCLLYIYIYSALVPGNTMLPITRQLSRKFTVLMCSGKGTKYQGDASQHDVTTWYGQGICHHVMAGLRLVLTLTVVATNVLSLWDAWGHWTRVQHHAWSSALHAEVNDTSYHQINCWLWEQDILDVAVTNKRFLLVVLGAGKHARLCRSTCVCLSKTA